MQHLLFMPWERLQLEQAVSREAARIAPAIAPGTPAAMRRAPACVASQAEDDSALRWRDTILRLSEDFTATAASHPELGAILLEALSNALEQLLLFGRARDFEALETWLLQETSR